MYNRAILEYAYYAKEPPTEWEYEYEITRYIYYDNPGIILFVNDALACRIHFCFWQLLNSLKKESIKSIKRCA